MPPERFVEDSPLDGATGFGLFIRAKEIKSIESSGFPRLA
jgi:hypothetical protein